IAGHDPKDDFSVKRETENFTSKINTGVKGCVIGVPSSFYSENIDEKIKVNMEQTMQVYKALGTQICYINIEGMEEISQAFQILLRSEAYATHKVNIERHFESWDSEAKNRLLIGKDIKAYEYVKALETKKQAISQFNQIFEKVDVILTPVTAILPTNIHEREVEIKGSKIQVLSILNKLTGPTNLVGLPSISVPFKAADADLPNGFQLIGRPFGESELYKIAHAYEEEVSIKSNLN